MGNQISDFESQFFKLYSFISIVEDPYFKSVKIYRKVKHNFNHIMIAEAAMADLSSTNTHLSSKAFITEKLSLIRRFQNRYTVQLQYFHLLQQKRFDCGAPIIRMYIDYYNYTLLDYLSALRMKKQSLTIDELILVIQSLAEAILTLRKMGLDSYRITLSNIFLIVEDGIVILNPIYFLYDSLSQAYNAKTIHALTQQFELYPQGERQNRIAHSAGQLESKQKEQLNSIVIEMTRYLNHRSLEQSESILRTLNNCSSISEISTTFVCAIDELNVQQFGESSEQMGQLY